jgi:hypothetical protein
MRIRTIGLLGASLLAVSACGSTGGKSAVIATPPTPVNLTVYVNNARVSVSPASVGAGPVIFVVTNQASRSVSLAISRAGGSSQSLASTAPINPQGTTQVSVNFRPGDYTIATSAHGRTDATFSQQSNIRPAAVHVGRRRPSASNDLISP